MEIKFINTKMKRKEIAKISCISTFTLQRYRHDTKMQSPYKLNNPKRPEKTSNYLERPQKTPLQMWILPLLALQVIKTIRWQSDRYPHSWKCLYCSGFFRVPGFMCISCPSI